MSTGSRAGDAAPAGGARPWCGAWRVRRVEKPRRGPTAVVSWRPVVHPWSYIQVRDMQERRWPQAGSHAAMTCDSNSQRRQGYTPTTEVITCLQQACDKGRILTMQVISDCLTSFPSLRKFYHFFWHSIIVLLTKMLTVVFSCCHETIFRNQAFPLIVSFQFNTLLSPSTTPSKCISWIPNV